MRARVTDSVNYIEVEMKKLIEEDRRTQNSNEAEEHHIQSAQIKGKQMSLSDKYAHLLQKGPGGQADIFGGPGDKAQ